jgi:hypothetical protein
LLSVFRAVFFQQTLEVAQRDREITISRKAGLAFENESVTNILERLDHNDDKRIDWVDFSSELCASSHMKAWMSSLDIDAKDLDKVFQQLADGNDGVDCLELLVAASRIKGQASATDIAYLLHKQQQAMRCALPAPHAVPSPSKGTTHTRTTLPENKESKGQEPKESKELRPNALHGSKQPEPLHSGKAANLSGVYDRPVPFHQGPAQLDSLPREESEANLDSIGHGPPKLPRMLYPKRKSRPPGVPPLRLPKTDDDAQQAQQAFDGEAAAFDDVEMDDLAGFDLAEVDQDSIGQSDRSGMTATSV